MRCLSRNKRRFYFANYQGTREIIDDEGLNTGEYEPVYSEIEETYGNISVGQGDTESRQFGSSIMYDKVIVMDDPNIPIDEYSILWVDIVPDANSNIQHDYIVKGVHRGINSISIAISKVSVSG